MESEGWERTLKQMWEMYIYPEIMRRCLPEGFNLIAAQALFPPTGPSSVLLNEEVRGSALLRAPRNISAGEAVRQSDVQHIERYELPDDLIDNGHFTMIQGEGGWRVFFNFLSGRGKAKDILLLSAQFHEAAVASAERGHAGPSVENLFSAVELVSKAELILHRSKAATAKKHGTISSEINAWARLGNMDSRFVELFNRLSNVRPNARYGDATHRPPVPDKESFDLVAAMIERGLRRVSSATELITQHQIAGETER